MVSTLIPREVRCDLPNDGITAHGGDVSTLIPREVRCDNATNRRGYKSIVVSTLIPREVRCDLLLANATGFANIMFQPSSHAK